MGQGVPHARQAVAEIAARLRHGIVRTAETGGLAAGLLVPPDRDQVPDQEAAEEKECDKGEDVDGVHGELRCCIAAKAADPSEDAAARARID